MENKNSNKKIIVIIICVIIVIISVIIGIILSKLSEDNLINKDVSNEIIDNYENENKNENENKEILEDDNIINKDTSNDIIADYEYKDEEITEDNGMKFINNEVLLFFDTAVSLERIKDIANELGAEVVMYDDLTNICVFKFDEPFDSMDEVTKYGNKLVEDYEEIELATYNGMFESVWN